MVDVHINIKKVKYGEVLRLQSGGADALTLSEQLDMISRISGVNMLDLTVEDGEQIMAAVMAALSGSDDAGKVSPAA